MIIVRLFNGLGNQLFQYAFAKYLQKKYPNQIVKLDSSYFNFVFEGRFFCINNFNLDLEYCTEEEIETIYSTRIRDVSIRGEEIDIRSDNLYIHGYWQDIRYLDYIGGLNLKLDIELDEFDDNMLKEIKECNSVGIHVRRGDYLKYSDTFRVCEKEYFEKSISIIKKKENIDKIYIFSDDMKWCFNNLEFDIDYEYTSYDNYDNIYETKKDFKLLSNCKHFITSNSTYSWWASYISKNKDKIVISPKEWFTPEFMKKEKLKNMEFLKRRDMIYE